MPWIFGLLAGKGITGWLASLIVYGVIAALAIGTTATLWHVYVAKPYYTRGVADGKAEQLKLDAPKIATLTAERDKATKERDAAYTTNDELALKIGEVAKEAATSASMVLKLQSLAAAARAASARLMAQLVVERAKNAAKIDELLDVVSGKTPLIDECKSAEKILDDLADRMLQ